MRSTCRVIFFSTSETEVGCVEKLRHLYLFPGFLYSPRSHMINVLKIPCGLLAKILTQPMAPPRGYHRNGQERWPGDWKKFNIVMPYKLD